MRGDLKASVLSILSTGPADATSIGQAIRRTKPQAAAILAWMAGRGYVRRVRDGRAGRFGNRASVWASTMVAE